MTRNELKEIIQQVLVKVKQVKASADQDAPQPACLYGDNCDGPTSLYSVGEEG